MTTPSAPSPPIPPSQPTASDFQRQCTPQAHTPLKNVKRHPADEVHDLCQSRAILPPCFFQVTSTAWRSTTPKQTTPTERLVCAPSLTPPPLSPTSSSQHLLTSPAWRDRRPGLPPCPQTLESHARPSPALRGSSPRPHRAK